MSAPGDAPHSGHLRAILDQRGMILGYLNSLVRNLATAEDLLQESLVLATRQEFNDEAHALAWIRVTARNLAMNELRRRARQPVRLSDATLAMLESDWEREASGEQSHGRRLEALRACHAGLSAAAQRLLELRFHEDLDGNAIAARIGRPVNTVYVGLSRIYRRLAECIAQRLEASA